MVCCTDDGNDKGCCCCCPSYIGVWIFGLLTFLGLISAVANLFIPDSTQVRWQVGMPEEYYEKAEREMPIREWAMLVRSLLANLPFWLVLCMRKSYGARLCLFLTMLIFFVVDIVGLVWQLIVWVGVADYY